MGNTLEHLFNFVLRLLFAGGLPREDGQIGVS